MEQTLANKHLAKLTLLDGHGDPDAEVVKQRKNGRVVLISSFSTGEVSVYTHFIILLYD